MPKNTSLLLILWNVLLSALLGWVVLRKSTAPTAADPIAEPGTGTTEEPRPVPAVDTATLAHARIAFFYMDSIQSGFDLVTESADRVKSMGRQLEGSLSKELQKAQAEAQRLMEKDHTYSTQAEVAADEARLHELDQKIGEMRMSSQDRIDEMQMRLLQEITLEIQDFLTEYNAGHKFDFIFSIQNEGQIWVGNKGLDVTADVVAGLNARHRAKKVAGSTPENK